MIERPECKYCKKKLVMPYGPPKSKILLVGEFPGKDEIMRGIPFVGKTGEILHKELAMAGLNMMNTRMTNLWLHQKVDDCKLDWHIAQLVKEMKGKKFVLFMGSDLVDVFFDGKSVIDLSSMEVRSKDFPKQRIFVSVNPAYALHGPVGELRLAVNNFVEAIRRADVK